MKPLINQIFELQLKLTADKIAERYERQFNRIHDYFEQEGYTIINPLGKKYDESLTNMEANLVGPEGKNMHITQVIKPAIYLKVNNEITLIQKAIVIVEKQ